MGQVSSQYFSFPLSVFAIYPRKYHQYCCLPLTTLPIVTEPLVVHFFVSRPISGIDPNTLHLAIVSSSRFFSFLLFYSCYFVLLICITSHFTYHKQLYALPDILSRVFYSSFLLSTI